MNEPLNTCLHEAQECLEDARVLLTNERYEACMNRCYYAYFWTVRGLLQQRGVFAKTHMGVHNRFSELYVKTGEIPVKFNEYLNTLANDRQQADYEPAEFFTDEDARVAFQRAEEFFHYVQEKYAQ